MNQNDSQGEEQIGPDKPDGDTPNEENTEVVSAVIVEPPHQERSPDEPQDDVSISESSASKTRVGVKMADGKLVDFDPGDMDLSVGDTVVVNNDRDLNLGKVCYVIANDPSESLRRVARKIGSHDMLLMRRNAKREEEAFDYCNKRIAERNLPMKLVRTAFLHGGNKAIFFFTADGRVDFRALVRDLAQQLHVRIEMRQIGVRDEARLLGGVGICGQPLCCSRYLRKFIPVSIKMAKNQGLALNPQKVSGLCGRLMCCLVYEDETYNSLRKEFPRPGKTIDTPVGPGRVLDSDLLASRIKVSTDSGLHVFTKRELEEGPIREDEKLKKEAQDEARAAVREEHAERSGRRRKSQPKRSSRGRGVAAKDRKKSSEEPRSASSGRRRRKKKPSGSGANNSNNADKPGLENRKVTGPGKQQPASSVSPSSKKRRPRRRSRRKGKRKSTQSESGNQSENKGA